MQNNNKEYLSYWLALRKKVCEKNHTFRRRSINGTHEKIHSLENASSLFLWINRETASFPLHWHSNAEIIMPVDGDYLVKTSRTAYHLQENEILILPPGELHELHAPSKGMRLILLFDTSHIGHYKGFSLLYSLLSQPLLITPDTMPAIFDELQSLLTSIAEEYANDDPLSEPSILALLIQFFVLLARTVNELPASPAVPASPQSNKQREYVEKFNTVFDYIDHYYMEEISLESAAAKIGFSKFHFSRLFRQFTDTSFYDYLCLRRLRAAETLLLDPSLPITEVALQSGFSSISTFNRVFKKFKQCTPTEFKEFYKQNARSQETQ